ncbi:hypothetical protein FQN49_008566, partial [Arthroderma sp. PD_2]
MGNMPNLGSLLHSVSPLADESKQFPGMSNMMPHSHFNNPYTVGTPLGRTNEFENPMQQQPLDEPNIEVEVDTDTIKSNNSGPEIAHPTPRGHRHNVSETLQKGVEREYQLENAGLAEEQRIEDDLMNSRWAAPGEQSMDQHSFFPSESMNQSNRLQQHIFDEQQAHKENRLDEASDLETNPSIKDSRSPVDNYHHKAKHSTGSAFIPGHKSASSISKLNVTAKAFDPSMPSFSPTTFSFMPTNNFQPTFGGFSPRPAFPYTQNIPQSASHSAHSSGFNVAAPAFAPVPKPQEPLSPPSNFKFSSATFNVAAPVFNPGASFTLPSAEKPSPSSNRTKIFDNFDPSAIIPPAKASKAIPIVRPGENEENEPNNDQMEGRFGAQGREKRARRVESQGGEHSDAQELMFAMSPAAADSKRAAALVEDSDDVPADIAENRKRTEDEIIETILSAHGDESELEEGEIREDDTTVAKPFEFRNSEDAAAFSNAHPSVLGNEGVTHDQEKVEPEPAHPEPEVAGDENGSLDQEEQDTIVEDGDEGQESPVEEVSIEHKSSVLQPTAKPFEFVPSEPPARAVSPVVSPVQTPVSPPPKKQGLYASRYAVSEPDSPEPARKQSALTAGLKAAEQIDEPAAERVNSSDEEEIDAVMKQLNDGDSSVGVERLGTPPQPAHQETLDDAAPQLAPSNIARSNAPSPSLQGEQWQPQTAQKPTTEHMLPPPTLLAQRSPALNAQSPIRQLNTQPQDHISDWDDAISSGEDGELRQRPPFFETRVNNMVQTSIGDHLAPIERTLNMVLQSVAQNQPKALSARVEHSDADDEDDEEEGRHRSRSPWNKRDKLAERMKSTISEAVAAALATNNKPVEQE